MLAIKHATKQIIKRSIQHAAARFGRHTRSPADVADAELVVLMYHRVLPATDPRAKLEEPGMMVTPETFQLHMEAIQDYFSIVKLDDWLDDNKAGKPLPPRACAITFDDGWRDNYEFAYPILKQMGLPATIFLVAEMIGGKRVFWPERLVSLLSTLSATPELWNNDSLDWLKNLPMDDDIHTLPASRENLSRVIAACKPLTDDEINHFLDAVDEQIPPSQSQQAALLDWQQINEMLNSGLIDIGSHTCQHTRLTHDKSTDVLQHEVVQSKKIIEDAAKRPVTSFCYPNGNYTDTAHHLVANTYAGAVTTERGWNTAKSDLHLLKRIGVHNDITNDRTSFLARLSGWI